MPASFNRVFLLGNLTRDPELRYIPSGQAVTTFTVAANRTYLSPAGEKKEDVSFVRIVTWARLAETCNEYLRKGSQVFVEGRLQSRSWSAQDGTKRSTIEVVANSVQFLGRAPSQQDASVTSAEEQTSVSRSAKGAGETLTEPSINVSEDELVPDNDVPF
ncbi:MAG: single-stranded DNA-binding protein [Candidatus Omnitrophica bacterium]|nr:single-stranded DNA-binding protein [Candidatus Omnitrophota bacterium]